MKPHIWLLKLMLVSIVVLGIPVGGVMAFNYYIDPLWNFDHSHEYNDFQRGHNERIQKTNWINSHHFDFDSLMIGTSRTTYINASNFEERVFHYGLSSLHITEYLDYMQYAQSKNPKEFETIYMELTVRSHDLFYGPEFSEAETFFSQSEDPFYPVTSLFSKDTYDRAKFNYDISKNNYAGIPRTYDRNLEVTTSYVGKDIGERIEFFKNQLVEREANGPEWIYDPNYRGYLEEIQAAFPHSNFVVFTDLMPAERLQLTIEHPQIQPTYKQYITDIVEVFGAVYSFHQYNDVTRNHANFFDLYHFYPSVGDLVAKELQRREPSELLYIVTKDNIDEYFAQLGI
ncbi:hypothetical protein [Lysinibacillus sp. LZ02]|uniref:hypothetical protein n=1 Tax=Lysinibacillus sp. LZ02 TaxID=3420668 RepID=UPI003D35F788